MMSTLINAISFVVALQGVATEQSNPFNQTLFNQAQDCSAIMSDKQRLACFDAVFKGNVREVRKQVQPSEIDSTIPIAASTSSLSPSLPILESSNAVERKQDAIEKFGGEHLEAAKEKAPKLEVVNFTIEKVELTIRKQQRFFFTNGQIWENKTSKELRVEEGDQVAVKDGALSAFYLSKVDGTRSVRVKRVK